MKIRSGSFYLPYAVNVNGKGYHVSDIHFYDESGVVVSTGQGWLQTGRYNGDIKEIELPIDEIKLRRKQKFDGVVYAMLHKEEYGDTTAELYIPCNMLDIHFVKNKFEKDIWFVYKVYEGANGIHIEGFVKSLAQKLSEIRGEYDELCKEVEGYRLVGNTNSVLDNLDKMRDLAEAYRDEKARLESLTIDDIEL